MRVGYRSPSNTGTTRLARASEATAISSSIAATDLDHVSPARSLSGRKVRSGEHLLALLSNLVVEFGPGTCMPIRIEEEKTFRPDALAVFAQASDKPGPQMGHALEALIGMVDADIGEYLERKCVGVVTMGVVCVTHGGP